MEIYVNLVKMDTIHLVLYVIYVAQVAKLAKKQILNAHLVNLSII